MSDKPPPNAASTRQRLIDAATRGFAEDGIHGASLLEITRQAGQRNRGAVHYHFGSRTGMLAAVLEQHVDYIAARERELLTVAREGPPDDLASCVSAFVRPAVELGEMGWQGRCYLMILAEIVEQDDTTLAPEIVTALQRAGGYDVIALLEERTPPMSEELRSERISLMSAFILRAVADRGRAEDRTSPRAQLATGPFVDNLVAMAVGMLSAPLPDGSA